MGRPSTALVKGEGLQRQAMVDTDGRVLVPDTKAANVQGHDGASLMPALLTSRIHGRYVRFSLQVPENGLPAPGPDCAVVR